MSLKQQLYEYDKLSTHHFTLRKQYDAEKDKENAKIQKVLVEKYDKLSFDIIKDLDIASLYDEQVTKENTRANRSTRYYHYQIHKNMTIEEKERMSIELIKMALKRSKNPTVSCSFGIDSMVTLYLTRKALVELGRDPSDVTVVWCDTLNEFPEVRLYAKRMEKEWNLNLYISKPKKPLKKVIDEHGGVDSSYFFTRKGDRRNGRPLSEKCCGVLKHEPMKRAIKENNWDLQINGVRADESTQRLRACLRDGEYFYSSTEWKAFACRAISWWLDDDIWEYVEKENIPYVEVYNKNTIQKYPMNNKELIHKHRDKLAEFGADIEGLLSQQVQTISNRKLANFLDKIGYVLFTPRVGW